MIQYRRKLKNLCKKTGWQYFDGGSNLPQAFYGNRETGTFGCLWWDDRKRMFNWTFKLSGIYVHDTISILFNDSKKIEKLLKNTELRIKEHKMNKELKKIEEDF